MGYLNKVLLIGNLGQDPEKRITPAGHSVINVRLATTEYYKDQSGSRQERTEWHNVVFWNRLADIVEQYCQKGSSIYVEGYLQTREWQDKDGNRRFTTDIVARNMQLLGARTQSGQGGYQNNQSNYQQGGGNQNDPYNVPPQKAANINDPGRSGPDLSIQNDFIEDDIPF